MRYSNDYADKFWSKVNGQDENGCMTWKMSKTKAGYGQVRCGSKNMLAHRVAYMIVKGDIPEGMLIMHSCDNKPCCNPDHLSIGTHADNSHDMMRKDRGDGQFTNGHASDNIKIEKSCYDQIKQRRENGEKGIDLAAEYGVSPSLISIIKLGKVK